MVESTTLLKYDASLRAYRSGSPAPKKQKKTQSPATLATEKALRLTYGVIIPTLARQVAPACLGYARPAMARACVRDIGFFVELAKELDRKLFLLIFDCAASAKSDWKRIERRHLEDAAMDLCDAVRELSKPLRDVVIMRAVGKSWRAIARELPGRDYQSIRADHERALSLLWVRHGSTVRRIY